MSRVIIQNSLHRNKNREEVNNREIGYLPDLSIVNLFSVFVLIGRILNSHHNYPTHRLYFGEVEIPYNRAPGGVSGPPGSKRAVNYFFMWHFSVSELFLSSPENMRDCGTKLFRLKKLHENRFHFWFQNFLCFSLEIFG